MYRERYGSLVDWEEKAAHRADTLGAGYLMEVLCSIVAKILDGVDNSQPPRIDKWINLISNAAFRETGVVEWTPHTNQAFSPPPELDSKYLVSLAKTRLDATGDHLWYLQCDATYIRRHLKLMFATEIFKKASDTQKGVMVTQRIRYKVRSHHLWRWIEMECRHVDAARERFRDSTYPGTTLPVSYDRALGALELLLVNQVIYRASCLRELLPYVPGLQEHWIFEPGAKLPNAIGVLRQKKSANTQECLANDRLYWCLVQLLAKPDDQRTFDHSMLFAMLQEHMSNNPSERARLDEVIYQLLSDLATCHEMLMAVRFHRPQNAARTFKEVKETEDRHVWRWLRSRSSNVEDFGDPQGIGMSLFKDFYLAKTPTGPKTSVWLAQSQELRAALEKFWESIRRAIRKDFEDSAFGPAEYLQDKQREEDAILAAIQKSDSPQPATNFFDGAESCSATTTIAPRPEKTKTRGKQKDDITPAHNSAPGAQAESIAVFEATAIKVTKQSLDIFLLMFPEKDDVVKDVL
ncbi:hypothetical protein BGZ61DRAFT_464929 [Ilyonectria robusta]|uniref:uncharacterized protein n=1 Tax=Ilyonectria robusta TaxID=1079257 RepID=UPI001E8D1904|nr:uncharacterized protein BGZ61DRAFT_464929 [Ilyonectria robusta]KAH8659697.1 hypothetical protein BGZ61DRAFT_464929 [Ilyonectria robusta]